MRQKRRIYTTTFIGLNIKKRPARSDHQLYKQTDFKTLAPQ